jgi:hypothetical protein
MSTLTMKVVTLLTIVDITIADVEVLVIEEAIIVIIVVGVVIVGDVIGVVEDKDIIIMGAFIDVSSVPDPEPCTGNSPALVLCAEEVASKPHRTAKTDVRIRVMVLSPVRIK